MRTIDRDSFIFGDDRPAAILHNVRIVARGAWWGAYEHALLTSDGEVLCFKCARTEYRNISDSTRHASGDGWQIAAVYAAQGNDGTDERCDHCYRLIQTGWADDQVREYLAGYITRDDLDSEARQTVDEIDAGMDDAYWRGDPYASNETEETQ